MTTYGKVYFLFHLYRYPKKVDKRNSRKIRPQSVLHRFYWKKLSGKAKVFEKGIPCLGLNDRQKGSKILKAENEV
jgi:hypothetical protein